MRYVAVNPVGDSVESGFRVMVLRYFSRVLRRAIAEQSDLAQG